MGFGGVFILTSVKYMIIWEDQSAKINGNSGIEVVAVHNFLILKLLFWPFQVSFPFQDTQNASDVNFSSRKLTWLAGISPFLIGDTGYIFKRLFFHCHCYFSGGVSDSGNLLAMWIYSKVPQLLQRGGWPLVLRCLAASLHYCWWKKSYTSLGW